MKLTYETKHIQRIEPTNESKTKDKYVMLTIQNIL